MHSRSKKALFGVDKLVKDITLDDLTEEDHHFLALNAFQILKEKDVTGRLVWYLDSRNYDPTYPYLSQVKMTSRD